MSCTDGESAAGGKGHRREKCGTKARRPGNRQPSRLHAPPPCRVHAYVVKFVSHTCSDRAVEAASVEPQVGGTAVAHVELAHYCVDTRTACESMIGLEDCSEIIATANTAQHLRSTGVVLEERREIVNLAMDSPQLRSVQDRQWARAAPLDRWSHVKRLQESARPLVSTSDPQSGGSWNFIMRAPVGNHRKSPET